LPKAIKLLKPHFVREIIAKMPKHKAKAKKQAWLLAKTHPKYIHITYIASTKEGGEKKQSQAALPIIITSSTHPTHTS